MFKKLMLLAMALAAFVAFAAPVAQADEVTNAGGEEAEEIEATSSNMELTTAGGAVIKCSTIVLFFQRIGKGHYTTPFTNIFIAKGHGTNHNNPECVVSPSGVTFLITSIHYTVKFKNNGLATTRFRYTYQITHPVFGPLPCFFETSAGEAAEEGSTYEENTDNASVVSEMTGGSEGGGAACAAAGETHGDFTITDENGEPASIH